MRDFLRAHAEGTNEKKCIWGEPEAEFHLGSGSGETRGKQPADKTAAKGLSEIIHRQEQNPQRPDSEILPVHLEIFYNNISKPVFEFCEESTSS